MSNKGIYIATSESNSGKSLITLGLMSMLLGKTAKVGYFRPIAEDSEEGKSDSHIETMVSHFGINISFDKVFCYTKSQFIKMKSEEQLDTVIYGIISRYKELEEVNDFVLVEGTSFLGDSAILEIEINLQIAKNLQIPTIIVGNGVNKSNEEMIDSLNIVYSLFKSKEVEVVSLIANKIDSEKISELNHQLVKKFPASVLCYSIPSIETLSNPTIQEIVTELNGEVLFGHKFLENQIGSFTVAAMQLRNYLSQIKENCLVITPGDRADIILGVLQANQSENYPNISGIALTGGLLPEETILRLIDGLEQTIPIILVEDYTYSVTNRIGNIKPKVYAKNKNKIEISIKNFEKYINAEDLGKRLVSFKSSSITPKMFLYNLIKKAKNQRKKIVLPEGEDDRIIIATSRLIAMDIVDLVLLGNRKNIEAKIGILGIVLDLNKIEIINPINSVLHNDYANTYYELRKHKGMMLEIASDLMLDVSYFGTMMVYKEYADGMVSGAANTTQHTIRPALQFIKTKPGINIVSSVFFMCLENRVSVFGDCAINPNPNAEELAQIAISSAETSLAFGIEPKVAMLSYSSGTSGTGDDVDTVRKATEIVKLKRPDLKIEGPIQYDAAVDEKVGKSKMPTSEVVGHATVLIFPDLNTGNNTYKAVQRETGALAIGPMLQGLNKPINDLSRGCTVEDIINTVIITSIQAQK